MRGAILEIDHSTAVDFLLPRHYSGRIPPISVAFGWYRSRSTAPEDLVAVVTFGKPASPWLCAEDYILGEYLKPTYIKEESAHA